MGIYQQSLLLRLLNKTKSNIVLTCTCIFTNDGCGARRALSQFCCAAAALSAARSLPGAFLSATGLSEELSSVSDSNLSAVLEKQSNFFMVYYFISHSMLFSKFH